MKIPDEIWLVCDDGFEHAFSTEKEAKDFVKSWKKEGRKLSKAIKYAREKK